MSQKLKVLRLVENTSKTQHKNGTRSFYDPIADCYYLSYSSGYVRRKFKTTSWWGGSRFFTIYQLNKTRKATYISEISGKEVECTQRIMISTEEARIERLAHCVATYRNNKK